MPPILDQINKAIGGPPGGAPAAAIIYHPPAATPPPAPPPPPTANTPYPGGTTGGGGGGGGAAGGQTYQQFYQNQIKQASAQSMKDLPGLETSAAGGAGTGLGASIGGLIDQLRAAQMGVDVSARQNELSKKTGTQDVLNMVNHGITGGNLQIGNAGGANSSAPDALAKAYNLLGREQLTKVGQGYEAGKLNVAQAQNAVDVQRAAGIRNTAAQKKEIVDNVVNDASQKIAAINAQMAGASLPDRIDMAGEVEKIRQAALGQLAQYDQVLSQGFGGISAATPEQSKAAAYQEAARGTAPANAFNLGTTPPAQLQNSGPFASNIPLFQFPKKATAQGG